MRKEDKDFHVKVARNIYPNQAWRLRPVAEGEFEKQVPQIFGVETLHARMD